ncbi:MAG: UDP-N-acetyl glucosamine 2-epimerase [Bdellovibrionota bacterium]
MSAKKTLAFVLGIRPDVIRAALILRSLREVPDLHVVFIWSGQHYSPNLRDIFFKELGVAPADIDLGCGGETDAEISASVISRLYPVLAELRPTAVVFLGDTNTTTGTIAAAQLNIPIVHIEGGMRSYDWRMPEEKYRLIADHLSDVIYCYFDEYKEQAVREGINPDNVVVVGNPIVDILEHYYFREKSRFDKMADDNFFASRDLRRNEFYLMTCHRRENVGSPETLRAIVSLLNYAPYPVYFPASYRTQKNLKEFRLSLPQNVIMVDPIGYEEMVVLMTSSRGVITDSGTVVEETAILQVPSLQLRRSTERPQTYDARSSVKFDPTQPEKYPGERIFQKLENLVGTSWDHNLGDGHSSERIAADIKERLRSGGFERHRPEHYHIPIARSYREDGLD